MDIKKRAIDIYAGIYEATPQPPKPMDSPADLEVIEPTSPMTDLARDAALMAVVKNPGTVAAIVMALSGEVALLKTSNALEGFPPAVGEKVRAALRLADETGAPAVPVVLVRGHTVCVPVLLAFPNAMEG